MKNVLVLCGNGYCFKEFYEPLIRELGAQCHIFLIIDKKSLSRTTLEAVEKLHRDDGAVAKYYVTEFQARKSIFSLYLACHAFLTEVDDITIDLFVAGEEGSPIQCFLMDHFKTKGALVVIVEQLLRAKLYVDYHSTKKGVFGERIKSFNISWKQRLRLRIKTKRVLGIVDVCVEGLVGRAKMFAARLKNEVRDIVAFRVLPFLFTGRCLGKPTPYMIGTHAETLISVDPIEYECVKTLVPTIKHLYLSRHPSYGLYDRPAEQEKRKLLVVIGGPLGVVSHGQMERWVAVVEKIRELKCPSEIHFRKHPRDREAVIDQFQEAFKKRDLQPIWVNSAEESLADGFEEYMGVVGSPSGALRFCREASQDIFVIGLTDVTGQGVLGHPLVLGSLEGMHWLNEGDEVQEEWLQKANRPRRRDRSVADTLMEMLHNGNIETKAR